MVALLKRSSNVRTFSEKVTYFTSWYIHYYVCSVRLFCFATCKIKTCHLTFWNGCAAQTIIQRANIFRKSNIFYTLIHSLLCLFHEIILLCHMQNQDLPLTFWNGCVAQTIIQCADIFRKSNIFYTLIHSRTCVYQGVVRNIGFS